MTPHLTTHDHTMTKYALDAAAGAAAVATLMSWLPPIAAIFSIAWAAIQIYSWSQTSETRFAKWLGRFFGR